MNSSSPKRELRFWNCARKYFQKNTALKIVMDYVEDFDVVQLILRNKSANKRKTTLITRLVDDQKTSINTYCFVYEIVVYLSNY